MSFKGKGKLRINKRELISGLVIVMAMLLVTNMLINLAKYPEQYITTWRYQLERDLENGNQIAIEYYNNNYVAKGKQLFGDKFDYLNMSKVIGYETSDNGVLLQTNDGNGYFIEK